MTSRFTLVRQLGRGGMGVVWQARDEESGAIVALKLLHGQYADDPEYLERFAREVELARRVNSPHVVRVQGYGVREGTPYLVMEYVEGQSLRERLARGPLPLPEARRILAQLADGLAACHAAGIVHRDVKPSNVLLAPDGTAKLGDFGIARAADLTSLTGTGALLGTPAYLAPEGARDERSDLYALGCVAYELLAGMPPFAGSTPQEVFLAHLRETPDLGRVPPADRPLLGRLLAKEPGQRPGSAAEVVAALGGKGLSQIATTPARATPTPAAPRRRPRWALLAAAALVVAVLLLAVGTGLIAHPGASPSPAVPAASLAAAVGSAVPPSSFAVGLPSSGTSPISPRRNPLSTVATYSVGVNPSGVAFDGTNIWVTNTGSSSVTKLLAATGAVVATYSAGRCPNDVVFGGSDVWVTNACPDTVTKLVAATGTLMGTYHVGRGPGALAFDGTNIWVANTGPNSVTKLVAATGAVLGTYDVGGHYPIALVSTGSSIWVANAFSNTVTKLAVTSGIVVGSYRVGISPGGLAFDGTNIWVANSGSNTLMKLVAATGAVVGTYHVGVGPSGLAFDGANIWAANSGSNTLMKVDAATGVVGGTYAVGMQPVAVASDGTSIWVANSGSNTVTRLTP